MAHFSLRHAFVCIETQHGTIHHTYRCYFSLNPSSKAPANDTVWYLLAGIPHPVLKSLVLPEVNKH